MLFRTKCFFALSLAVCSVLPAMGASVAYEGFNYANGTLINGQSGGTGWSSSWAEFPNGGSEVPNDTVSSTGLTYANGGQPLVVSGGSLTAIGSSVQQVSDDVRSYSSASTTLYFSFLLKKNATGDASLDYGGLSINADGGSGGATGFFVGLPGASNVFAVENSGGGGSVASTAPAYTLGDTAFLVARVTLGAGNDSVRLFVNPVPGASEASSSDTSTEFVDKTNLDIGSSFVSLEFLSGTNATWTFDELRIGTAFADVTPSAVPEPASLGLLAIGAIGLLRRRPRRQ